MDTARPCSSEHRSQEEPSRQRWCEGCKQPSWQVAGELLSSRNRGARHWVLSACPFLGRAGAVPGSSHKVLTPHRKCQPWSSRLRTVSGKLGNTAGQGQQGPLSSPARPLLAESTEAGGAAGTRTCAIWDAGTTGCSFTHATVQAPKDVL